jgi:GT2 family glycosyltransferase
MSHRSAAAGLPPVTILLLNWNGWRDTVECLESLFRLDYPQWNVVVCDNASTDGSVDRIRAWAEGKSKLATTTPSELRHLVDPPTPKPIPFTELSRAQAETTASSFVDRSITVIHNGENRGFAAGNNVGLRHILLSQTAKYVWILNNDVVVARDALRELVLSGESGSNVGGVGGTMYEYANSEKVDSAGGGTFAPWRGMGVTVTRAGTRASSNGESEPALDFLTGGCLLVPLVSISRVGLMDESYFMYGEDVDFSLRMRQAGLKLAYAPAARVWHKGGASTIHRSARHDYYIVRNSLHLVRKYYPKMLPIATMYIVYQCALPKMVRRQWQRLSVLRRAYRDFLDGVFGPPESLPGESSRAG